MVYYQILEDHRTFFLLRPANHYQVDLTSTPDQVCLPSDEHIHYQINLTGSAEKVCQE